MAPTLIAHYRVLDQLGEGGMGVVYRAEDTRLGREVAVKVLRADSVQSAEWLGRFEREARLASSLQHPHICTIHELGEHEGQPFIVMERLEGRTVRQMIDGPLPAERVIAFARQTADALDAAHRRGIIHRDIKPANLFVTYGDHLKVLDFGLAKIAADEPPTATAHRRGSDPTMSVHISPELTRTGDTVGTTSYMSPEQALGHPVDARTDLFSLGSVMYEMATGRRAFGGDDAALVVMKVINGIIVPPRVVNPNLPEPLEAIILRLLAVDPGQRYETAAELASDLDTAAQQLNPVPATDGANPGALAARRRGAARLAAPLLLGAVILAGVAKLSFSHRPPALTDRDSILIGGFENGTGDPVFDETLGTALKGYLGQSPFLDIVTDQRIRETLRLMDRQPDERLTHPVARDACVRMGVKAMLEGRIAPLGTNYVLTLNATDCQTGETLARAQAQATSRESVLKELGAISSTMRTTLGESLPSLERFDVPIEQATTPSLAALKAYTLALEERRRGRELESVAFFNQAIEIDPEFASAYVALSTVYGSLGEWRRSEAFARQAYERRNRVSERERLLITYQYHDRVTGDQDRAAETLEIWKAAFPRESRPSNALALIHNRLGRYNQAVAEAREALKRTPGHPFPLSNLAMAYRSMGRYEEARRVAQEAVSLGVATSPTRRLLFQLGTIMGDESAAAQVEWARDRPREFDMIAAQAQVAAYEGRTAASEELYRRAIELALARNLRGTASGYAAHLAWTEALYNPGAAAAGRVRRTLSLVQSPADAPETVPRFRAATAFALAGLTADALAIVKRAEQRYPESTLVRTVLVPATMATINLHDRKPEEAIQALEAASAAELGTVAGLVPMYLRGEAWLRKGQPADALREFGKILQHRGVDPFAPVVPLAHLGSARAHARAGDIASSRQAYETLFTIWRAADPGFAPLAAAREEYARLATPPAPTAAAGSKIP